MNFTKLSLLLVFIPMFAHGGNDDCVSRKTVPDKVLDLSMVVELGLCRNPETMSAYYAMESARYNKNAGYASYLPAVNGSADINKNYQNHDWQDWQYGASISASYLIFDFGKRLADLNQLSSTWRAMGFDYDDRVQNYVYGVIGAYYALLNADADVESARSLRAVAQVALDTANKKYKAGSLAEKANMVSSFNDSNTSSSKKQGKKG